MNSALEFHDSDCLAIEVDSSGNGAVILDAYVHRTDGEPGWSPGDGGKQQVRLSMESMTRSGIGTLPATIFKGALIVGNSSLDLVPLPFQSAETCELKLVLLDDARELRVTGKNMLATPEGEFRYVEHVDFSNES